MLKQISSTVHIWYEVHGAARDEPYLWNSYLIQVEDSDVIILVDPLPLSAEEIRAVEEIGTPTHILLTCNWHLRESQAFRQKWGCQVYLHQDGLKDSEVPVDGTLQDGDLLWDLIQVIYIPDVHWLEEVAFLVMGDGNTMIVGDLVCGGRKDRGVPDGELWINAPEYIFDLLNARNSLRKLSEYSFAKLCFCHGTPITQSAKDVFNEFIENDGAWEKLKAEKVERADASSREFLRNIETKKSR